MGICVSRKSFSPVTNGTNQQNTAKEETPSPTAVKEKVLVERVEDRERKGNDVGKFEGSPHGDKEVWDVRDNYPCKDNSEESSSQPTFVKEKAETMRRRMTKLTLMETTPEKLQKRASEITESEVSSIISGNSTKSILKSVKDEGKAGSSQFSDRSGEDNGDRPSLSIKSLKVSRTRTNTLRTNNSSFESTADQQDDKEMGRMICIGSNCASTDAFCLSKEAFGSERALQTISEKKLVKNADSGSSSTDLSSKHGSKEIENDGENLSYQDSENELSRFSMADVETFLIEKVDQSRYIQQSVRPSFLSLQSVQNGGLKRPRNVDINKRSFVTMSSLWEEKPVVIQFFRRFGCPLCRNSALKLSALTPILDKHNVKLVGIGLSKVSLEGLVQGNYWKGNDLFVDMNQRLYKALNFGTSTYGKVLTKQVFEVNQERLANKVKGDFYPTALKDSKKLGGTFVVSTSGKVLFEFRQKTYGDVPDFVSLLRSLGICKSELQNRIKLPFEMLLAAAGRLPSDSDDDKVTINSMKGSDMYAMDTDMADRSS